MASRSAADLVIKGVDEPRAGFTLIGRYARSRIHVTRQHGQHGQHEQRNLT